MLWLDAYERRARLAPGLVALLPIAFAVMALGIDKMPVASACAGLLSAAGGPVLLATYVRRLGLKTQERLWALRGGAPTTIALRLREESGNPLRRDLWRRAVEAVTRVQLLDEPTERANPASADNAIEAAVARLRELTRGDKFLLVSAENKNYGFQRNFYGLRNLGRLVAASTSALLAVVLAYQIIQAGHGFVTGALVVGLMVDSCLLVIWTTMPSLDQVWRSGEKYAMQLLEAAATIEMDTPSAGHPSP